MEKEKSIASYILSGVALFLDIISIFVFGWLSIIGLILSAVGLALSEDKPTRILGGIGIAISCVCIVLWIIALAIIF